MNYKIFWFQIYLNNLRLPYTQKKKPEDGVLKFLDSIPGDIEIEETSFYKEYLSRFDIPKAIEGYELVVNPEVSATRDDYLIFIRLICASFGCDFEVLFNEDNKTVEFLIKVESNGRSAVRSVQSLYYLQIIKLMESFLKEQVESEAKRLESPEEKAKIDVQRDAKASRFQEKLAHPHSSLLTPNS